MAVRTDDESPARYRFANCELDARTGVLQRGGTAVTLQEQPLRALLLLIEHAGDVVTRDELRRRVWDDETFVDFEHGLNSIVSRLREALGDVAETPTFIQTVPRRGYRFLAAPEPVPGAAPSPAGPGESVAFDHTESSARTGGISRGRGARAWLIAAGIASVAAGAYAIARSTSLPARPSAPHPVRLAVLPFENLTGSDEQQFFADGLHEEMIVRLARMQPRELAVIARPSVMHYREAPKPIAVIARELGVDFVLEGSVRRSGDRFRVTAQLIRARDQSHLWTESYDRSWDDVLAIQSDVGARVAESLALQLLPPSQAGAAAGRIGAKAYEHYLRGRFYWNQRTRNPPAQLGKATDEFRAAIAAQPEYAMAYAALADAYDSMFFSNPAAGDTPYSNSRDALKRALQLDPSLPAAYSTLGWMTLHFDRNMAEAQRAFERALALDPADSLARFRYAHVLAIRGRVADAEREAEAARRYDPLSADIPDLMAWLAYYRGDRAAALRQMKAASDLQGNSTRLCMFSAYLAAADGDCGAATPQLGPPAVDMDTLRMGEAVFARARCGDARSVAELEQELLKTRLTYSTALFHYARGDRDGFFEWLNRAIDERFPEALYLGVDPLFEADRGDSRFQSALRRLGL